jgi:hypothetical protein
MPNLLNHLAAPGCRRLGSQWDRCGVHYVEPIEGSRKGVSSKSRLLGNRWLPQTMCADCAVSSGDPLPPSPPAEKANARKDQARQSGTSDGAGNRVGTIGGKRDVGAGVGAADHAVSADSEPLGHRIEATAGVSPNSLVKGRVGSVKQMARQRNGGSEHAVCGIEESIHLHRPTIGEQVLPER